MRWMKSRRSNICTSCIGIIVEGSDYYGNSSSAFCETCGVEKQNKEIQYSRKSKKYTEVKNNTLCYKCKQVSIGHLMGKSVCQDHIGDAVLE